MIYLYIDKNQIKLLHLKKSLLGQYEANYAEKAFYFSSLFSIHIIQSQYNLKVSYMKNILEDFLQNSLNCPRSSDISTKNGAAHFFIALRYLRLFP